METIGPNVSSFLAGAPSLVLFVAGVSSSKGASSIELIRSTVCGSDFASSIFFGGLPISFSTSGTVSTSFASSAAFSAIGRPLRNLRDGDEGNDFDLAFLISSLTDSFMDDLDFSDADDFDIFDDFDKDDFDFFFAFFSCTGSTFCKFSLASSKFS
eukprot:CCRYP_010515-RA/>CCRYP_010515-RA protein AED:0.38 eAED:0.45 QI:0/0.5/0.66/1/0/0/3/1655/155